MTTNAPDAIPADELTKQLKLQAAVFDVIASGRKTMNPRIAGITRDLFTKAAEAIADRARSPLAAPMAEGWRDMASAPKDGTRFLARQGDRHFDCWWVSDPYEGCFWQDEADSEPDPTHWMPLPPAPGTAPSGTAEVEPVAWVQRKTLTALADMNKGASSFQIANARFAAWDVPLYAHPPAVGVREPDAEVVRAMVDRFLQWPLPDDFSPDGGISFERTANAKRSTTDGKS